MKKNLTRRFFLPTPLKSRLDAGEKLPPHMGFIQLWHTTAFYQAITTRINPLFFAANQTDNASCTQFLYPFNLQI